MAKSARASVTKANRTKFRQNIAGPGELARAHRLSAKLLEVASKPKPRPDENMAEVDGEPATQATRKPEAMEIDSETQKSATRRPTNKAANRVQKKRRGKERNQIVFKSADRKGSAKQRAKK